MKTRILLITALIFLFIACEKDKEEEPITTSSEQIVELNDAQKSLIGTWKVYDFRMIFSGENITFDDFTIEFTEYGEIENSLNSPLTHEIWSFTNEKQYFRIANGFQDATTTYSLDISIDQIFGDYEQWAVINMADTGFIMTNCQSLKSHPDSVSTMYCASWKLQKS